jgi:phage tail-like protein
VILFVAIGKAKQEALMAHFREHPYSHFNFLVDLGVDIGTEGPHAGFQEVSGIAMEETGVEHRNGNEKEKSERKISGLNKSTDVTMKRGVIGSTTFSDWINQIRKGDHGAIRPVTIHLQNEDHTGVVRTWKLLRARIIKYTLGPMNAKGTDIAIEELVLGVERLEKVD